MFIGQLPEIKTSNESEVAVRDADQRVFTESNWLTGILSAPNTRLGVQVTPDSAINISSIYIGAKILCEDNASLPFDLFKRTAEDGREKAFEHPLYRILRRSPNEFQSAMDFRELMTLDAILRGVGLAEIVIERGGRNAGQIKELRRMHPNRIRLVTLKNGNQAFEFRDYNEKIRTLAWDQVFKVFGPFGMSIIQYMKNTVAMAMVQEQYSERFFTSYGRPGGVVKMKKRLQDGAAVQRFKESWQTQYAGTANSFGVAVLEEDAEWMPCEISNGDAELVDGMKMTHNMIAAALRVPAHMLNLLDRATFSNIDSQQQSYYTNTQRTWCVRWETAVERDLLLESEIADYYAEMNADALLRGDPQQRNAGYAQGRQNGWLSANDVRKKENMNPIGEQGDIYMVQAGYLPAKLVAQAKTLAELNSKTPPEAPKDDNTEGNTDGDSDPTED